MLLLLLLMLKLLVFGVQLDTTLAIAQGCIKMWSFVVAILVILASCNTHSYIYTRIVYLHIYLT